MKPKDIKTSFDKVQTDPKQREALLEGIQKRAKTAPPAPRPIWRRALVSVAACGLVMVIALFVWVLPSGGFSGLFKQDTDDNNGNLPPDFADDGGEREDMGDIFLYTQFGIKGRQYLPLSEANEWGLPLTVSTGDIGEKIADMENASDAKLVGSGVYQYKKTPGEAIVAAEIDGEWQLFRFFVFDSYNENGDEDTAAYLELYSIESAADITKVEFIRYTEEAKLNNQTNTVACLEKREEIEAFYNHYSIIKDSSAAYFDKLYTPNSGNEGGQTPEESDQVEQIPPDIPADHVDPPDKAPDQGETHYAEDTPAYADDLPGEGGREPLYDYGDETSAGSGGDTPGNADYFSNQVTVRIYARSGLYFDTVYYPEMGFISRHAVSEVFAQFLAKYIGGTTASPTFDKADSILGEWVYAKSTEGGTPIDIPEFASAPPTIEITDTPQTMVSFEDIVLTGTIKASFYESIRVGYLEETEGQSFSVTRISMLAEGDAYPLSVVDSLQYDPSSGLLRYDLSGTDVHHYFVRNA